MSVSEQCHDAGERSVWRVHPDSEPGRTILDSRKLNWLVPDNQPGTTCRTDPSTCRYTVYQWVTSDGVDNDNDGMTDEFDEQRFYTLEARHVDGDGYEGTFTNGIGGTIDLSNTCFYPTPIFPDLDDPYGPFCQNTDPFEILVKICTEPKVRQLRSW
jgi:hypothetical protein